MEIGVLFAIFQKIGVLFAIFQKLVFCLLSSSFVCLFGNWCFDCYLPDMWNKTRFYSTCLEDSSPLYAYCLLSLHLLKCVIKQIIVSLKVRSHDPFLRIRFLLVPKNGSCEHIKNDLPSNGSVILKKTNGNRTCSIFIRHSP